MKKIVIAVALAAFAAPVLGQYTGGFSGAINDQARRDLMEAQRRALDAYSRCLQTTPAALCGPPPQYQPPAARTPQTDYTCVDAMTRGGLSWAMAMQYCTR
jgi:type II secretory pathway pseudopilin PulG